MIGGLVCCALNSHPNFTRVRRLLKYWTIVLLICSFVSCFFIILGFMDDVGSKKGEVGDWLLRLKGIGAGNTGVLQQLCVHPEEVKLISQIPISSTSLDKIVWHYHPKGNYTVKSGYCQAILQHEVNSKPEASSSSMPNKSLWKQVWNLRTLLKIKMFWWKAAKRMLLLTDNISGLILSRVQHLLDMVPSNPERIIFHTSLANITWQIWKSRNAYVFGDVRPCPSSTMSRLNCISRGYNSVFPSSLPISYASVDRDEYHEISLQWIPHSKKGEVGDWLLRLKGIGARNTGVLQQSNVDVSITFRVSFTTVGDLEVLIKDIDAGKYEELLYGMTNDKHKLVMDALGALCDLIEAEYASNHGDKGIFNEINAFVKDLELGKHELWTSMSMEKSNEIMKIICNRWDDLLTASSKGDDSRPTSSDPIDIDAGKYEEFISGMTNDKRKLVMDALGALSDLIEEIDGFVKDLELGKHELWTSMSKEKSDEITKIVCNMWDDLLMARSKGDDTRHTSSDPIVQTVEINSKSTSYAGVAGKQLGEPWAEKDHGLNNKGFFFFKFDSHAGLKAVLKGGPWLIRKSLIILKKWPMDTRLLKQELTRIPVWVKLHDVFI
nr:hypothetical protein [Tanacetum cinerariifolium]